MSRRGENGGMISRVAANGCELVGHVEFAPAVGDLIRDVLTSAVRKTMVPLPLGLSALSLWLC